jgi:hypothetical protein
VRRATTARRGTRAGRRVPGRRVRRRRTGPRRGPPRRAPRTAAAGPRHRTGRAVCTGPPAGCSPVRPRGGTVRRRPRGSHRARRPRPCPGRAGRSGPGTPPSRRGRSPGPGRGCAVRRPDPGRVAPGCPRPSAAPRRTSSPAAARRPAAGRPRSAGCPGRPALSAGRPWCTAPARRAAGTAAPARYAARTGRSRTPERCRTAAHRDPRPGRSWPPPAAAAPPRTGRRSRPGRDRAG